MPSLNVSVRRLKVTILPLDLPCSGLVTPSGDILNHWQVPRKEAGQIYYSPVGRRNRGRPLKRLLDTWDRNGSTSGPTPWQIYGDDNDDEVTDWHADCTLWLMRLFLQQFLLWPVSIFVQWNTDIEICNIDVTWLIWFEGEWDKIDCAC